MTGSDIECLAIMFSERLYLNRESLQGDEQKENRQKGEDLSFTRAGSATRQVVRHW